MCCHTAVAAAAAAAAIRRRMPKFGSLPLNLIPVFFFSSLKLCLFFLYKYKPFGGTAVAFTASICLHPR